MPAHKNTHVLYANNNLDVFDYVSGFVMELLTEG